MLHWTSLLESTDGFPMTVVMEVDGDVTRNVLFQDPYEHTLPTDTGISEHVRLL